MNDVAKRILLWDQLRGIAGNCSGPWIITGDFINPLFLDNRIRRQINSAEIVPFVECVNYCDMKDMIQFDEFRRSGPRAFKFFDMWGSHPQFGELQKAKIRWLKAGDDNTSLFHRNIKVQAYRKKVLAIADMNRSWCEDRNVVNNAFIEYYKWLLSTDQDFLIKVDQRIVEQGLVVSGELAASLSCSNTVGSEDLVGRYKRKNTPPGCMFKVDIKKAYDSMNWEFLKDMVVALKFPEQFVKLVMECVTTPSFSLVLNDDMSGFFQGKKGLRIMQNIGKHREFVYHPRCKAVQLNHLAFADDLIIMSRGDEKVVNLLMRGLATFAAASGLAANSGKSNVYFCNV
ncbi:uncharacterized protein LOC110689027 [Chenopodium quinoa]|uniref:uncharacterized protein LOC110689027 n=1 Tax=Chenopodium quinoa TaxID=63459 RepID=UPI000B7908DA|nr:uncharacterized protein LOC110689027 [Chenopodium quinoa]